MATVGVKGLKNWSSAVVSRLAQNVFWRHSIRWMCRSRLTTGSRNCPGTSACQCDAGRQDPVE